ncbi:MAG: S-layer homology domain-containing protein [Schwartzia sp.]|nr:S-layer homology domain-containing protein [Schwartzia sp. (in: firmicutes)]
MSIKTSFIVTAALVFGIVTPSVASANPFEDVPGNHWAYDAVAQLAADGVIEGYGDGSYRGEQAITRYEMAQMVARAMAKNPFGADKALIDKLAAEFSDELNSLGVRVSALEKKIDNVKWGGKLRYRFKTVRSDGMNKINSQYVTLRFEPEMKINENWIAKTRIDYNTDMNTAKNSTGGAASATMDADPELCVDRVWVQGTYGNTTIKLGKIPFITVVDRGMIADDSMAGGQLVFGKDVKVSLTAGRTNRYPNGMTRFPVIAGEPENYTASYQGVEIYNGRASKWTWGVGWHRFKNEDVMQFLYNKKAANIWSVGVGYKFSKNLSANFAIDWNTAPDRVNNGAGNLAKKGQRRAWTFQIDYKGVDPLRPGSYGIWFRLRMLGRFAAWAPTDTALGLGQKGREIGIDYAFAKNVVGSLMYFDGKTMGIAQGDTDVNASTFFGELNFLF